MPPAPVADLITVSRLLIAPILPVVALTSPPAITGVMIVWGLLSDAADGTVARLTGTTGPHGARLDSGCDLAFYPMALIAALIAYPPLRDLTGTAIVCAVSLILPSVWGWFKFHRLPAYHTFLSRATLVTGGIGFITFLLSDSTAVLRATGAIAVVSALDDLLITTLLASWKEHIPHSLSLVLAGRRERPADDSPVRSPLT